MAKIFAVGLYSLSIALLIFSCLAFILNIVVLIENSYNSFAVESLIGLGTVQIGICALGIQGTKVYNSTVLLIGAIGMCYCFNRIV